MCTQPEAGRVVELLAGYLLASPRVSWPGAAGLTVGEAVVAAYPAAAAAGFVPRLGELERRHPDLAAALNTFFPVGMAC
jgi:hypothetical protein